MGKTKYIFITGGVVSGLGKGITAASLGRLLKSRGLKVTAQKLDPYSTAKYSLPTTVRKQTWTWGTTSALLTSP